MCACELTCTNTKFSLFKYPFSLRILASSDERSTVTWTMKFRIPEHQYQERDML